jgi:predicted enzyme related to lactoylglutathione lyase
MIQKISHTTVWVLNQDQAKEFYVETLGFEVKDDQTMEGFRWLTVAPKGQKDIEMVLMPITVNPMMDADTAETLRGMVKKGVFGGGVLNTDDCHVTYEQLKAKGVQFMRPPTEMPYGIEAMMQDNSGNWFSLVQRPK